MLRMEKKKKELCKKWLMNLSLRLLVTKAEMRKVFYSIYALPVLYENHRFFCFVLFYSIEI